jgi:hypothetical protein
MISKKPATFSNGKTPIDQLQKRFELWRQRHKPRTRIPERLWDSAVHVAAQYGLNRTAKVLHLDYYCLKKRLNGGNVTKEPLPSFIELPPPICGSIPECMVELENQNGAKMRIHFKGGQIPDLGALSSMFWRE